MEATNQRWTIQRLGTEFALHVEREKDVCEKVSKLYKTVVTGNGEPSLGETVRNHATWISNIDRLLWTIGLAVLGQAIVVSCALISGLLYLIFIHGVPFP